jgi:tetratricopeptide (TPR) repeat protein
MPHVKINVETAVREIVSTTRNLTANDPTAFPFFFIVGAGISAPMIPLASRIEGFCREAAKTEGIVIPDLSAMAAMDRYEQMLKLVHASAADRQAFLHGLIKDAPISPANLRLAHLLESRKLTNLVVTPNFDEMLTKALRLFGVDFVVCDHPKTVQRIDPNRADLVQIVHVHGTHWFYDCCNLKGEIIGRAVRDDDTVSMTDLLDGILAARSPIVVGYAGWLGDVIMTALERWSRQGSRKINLYWFCYRASEANDLPDFLRNHESVRVVVDEKEPIEASTVFQAINTRTKADAPAVTTDPLAFFASQLEKTLGNQPDDLYLIAQVIARVKRGSALEKEERERLSAEERRVADAIERLSDAVRRSAYQEALETLAQINIASLTIDQCVELDAALKAYYLAQPVWSLGETSAIFSVWLAAAEKALSRNEADVQRQAALAYALFAQMVCARFIAPEDESRLLDALLTRFGHLKVSVIAKAMESRAILLSGAGLTEPAADVRRQIRETFDDNDPELRPILDHSALNAAEDEWQSDEAVLKVASDIASRYVGETDYTPRQARANALRIKAGALLGLKRYDEAIETIDDFLRNHIDDSPEETTSQLLLTKAESLAGLRKTDAALTTLDALNLRRSKVQNAASVFERADALRKRLSSSETAN